KKSIEKPAKQINQQPILRSFLVNQGSTGESTSRLYDFLDKLKKQKGSGNPNFDQEKYDIANSAAKQIGDITKEMRAVENSPSMSGQEKREKLDILNRRRNEISRRVTREIQ
ncbi:hypothetical protein OD999_28045, partial [Priestia megaterium]